MGIGVLGPLTVDGDGSLSPRDRVVLSALVVRGGSATSMDQLADALWPDQPPASWNKVVPGCVNRLRKVLGARSIVTSPHGYRLAVTDDDIDARRFERLVAKGHQMLALDEPDRAILALREALALWRGPALGDVEEWPPAQAEAQRLDELRLEAEELVLDASLRVGQQAGILAEARARVAQAPVRERRWALLALAQYLSGAQAEALATLRRAREMLFRELALDPGPELVELERAMLRQDPALSAATALPRPTARCPYPGLLPYDVADADFFFGRTLDLAGCRSRLDKEGVLVLVGASGSGKSSLLRAGLVAALTREGITCVVPPAGTGHDDLLTELAEGDGSTVLVLDQFEEVMAGCPSATQRASLAAELVGATERRRLVLAVRADRFGDLSGLPGFGRLAERGLAVLGPLGEDKLREAIEGPAREAALLLEPGLVDLVLHEVRDDPGALPLLSHALRETWERREGRTLTVEGYRASGGIRGAVARSAEQLYDELPEGERSRLRDLMLRMLTLAPDGEPMRSWVPRGAIPADPAHQQLVEMLVRARLVTVDADALALAHETLARAWPRLRGWLDDDLEGQRILRHLSTAAATWNAMGRPDAELYRGDRLIRAREWQGRSGADLTDTERDFLDRAGQVADQEAAIQEREARYRRRTRRRLSGLVAVAAALTLAAGVAGAVAIRQRDRAASESQQAAAERLVASARRAATLSQGTDDISQALLLALEAVRRDDSPDTWASLLAALARSPALVGVVAANGPPYIDASPVGRRVAVRDDNRLRFLDAESQTSDETLFGDLGGSWVEFAADGDLLTTFGSTLVELGTAGRETRQFTAPGQDPHGWPRAAYSGDGRRLAAQTWRRQVGKSDVVVWDVDRPDRPTGRVTPGGLWDFALDQAGTRLIVVSSGPTWITMYDTASGRRLATVPPSPETRGRDDPRMVRLSPDGAVLAVNDGADVALLHPGTLSEITRLRGHTSRVTAVDFSQDGRLVAAGAVDGTVLVWARRTGALVEQLDGPPGEVTDLAYAPDSDTLYSGSLEGGVLVWDLGGERRFVSRVTGAVGDFGPLTVVAPDGRTVAHFRSSPTSGRTRGFDVAQVPSGRHSTVAGEYANLGAFSPTGERLATAMGNRVQVWDPRDERLVTEREVTGIDHARAVTFTGDGAWVVVGEREGTVQALDADTLAPVGRRASTPSSGAFTAMAQNGPQLTELLPTPDGRRVIALAMDDAAYAVVDPATGRVLDEVDLRWEPYATDGAVSPDGERLALTGEGGWVGVVDLRSGTWLSDPVFAHRGSRTSLDANPDGTRFATSGSDGRVILWDGATGERLATLRPSGPDTDVGMVYLPDGHTIQVANSRGEVFRWDTDPAAWQGFACRAAGRNLTREEWREAFDSEDYRTTCPDQPRAH
ncbi:BTAD domain-containing putative transcriptional regulator [Nocardioides guangzhouensis]|nr:BTAD domain-containing putative transcriptional regulator [Nocardioides guangzhouensis]